jgi:hypothetical protein
VTGWRGMFAWTAVMAVVATGIAELGSTLARQDPEAWRGVWVVTSVVAGWYVANRVVGR